MGKIMHKFTHYKMQFKKIRNAPSFQFLAVFNKFCLCRKLLRDIPAKILVQLCLSLLLLNLVFLLDGWLALYPAVGLCISTAFFLHYFLLTSFTWAGLEALHMYLSIVQVFTPYLSRYMLKFSLIGWGGSFNTELQNVITQVFQLGVYKCF